jgi:hypothetical protein
MVGSKAASSSASFLRGWPDLLVRVSPGLFTSTGSVPYSADAVDVSTKEPTETPAVCSLP